MTEETQSVDRVYDSPFNADDTTEETLTQISQRIYDLFVVNTESIGYQMPDGSYRRRTAPVSPMLIKAMLEADGSMGWALVIN